MILKNMEDVVGEAQRREKKTVVIAKAADDVILSTISMAREKGLIDAILIDDAAEIKKISETCQIDINGFQIIDERDDGAATALAVKMVKDGQADILMKGHLETKDFMHNVVATGTGLKNEDRVISSILAVEWKEKNRFIFISDIGFIPAPDLEQKKKIIENAVEAIHLLGNDNPKVAVICATETVNPKMQATVDALELEQMNKRGEITGCTVVGPISLDLAVSKESAKHKNYTNSVAGCADLFVMPTMEVGNVFAKAIDYFTDNRTSAIVMGASAPIIFSSRGGTMANKLNAIAFAVLLARKAG